MKFTTTLLFLFVSCTQLTSTNPSWDIFDKLIATMKSKSPEVLEVHFGKPDVETVDSEHPNLKILKYRELRVDAYLNKDTNKLTQITYFYWQDIDNYVALKKRFQKLDWIEEKLPDNEKSDVATDLYLVKIPELNMEFQYDNLAPKRKVMWIYFD